MTKKERLLNKRLAYRDLGILDRVVKCTKASVSTGHTSIRVAIKSKNGRVKCKKV